MSVKSDRRAVLKAMGICRDCRKPSGGTTRCKLCQKKKSIPGLVEWRAVQVRYRAYLSGEDLGRRQNGQHTRGLDWALANHRMRFAESAV